jgi:hypothetical protein
MAPALASHLVHGCLLLVQLILLVLQLGLQLQQLLLQQSHLALQGGVGLPLLDHHLVLLFELLLQLLQLPAGRSTAAEGLLAQQLWIAQLADGIWCGRAKQGMCAHH